MRLLSRIASAVLLGIVVLLAIDGYLSVRREIDLFDREMASDAILIGRTLKPLIVEAWKNGGETEAAEFVRDANRQQSEVEIRWVRIGDSVSVDQSPRVAVALLDSLNDNNEISIKATKGENRGYRYTYVSLPVTNGRAALEVSEPLSLLYTYTRSTVFRTVLLIAVLLIVSLLILWVLGVRFVGEPLEQLVEKTRRVGAGDFTGDVVLQRRDELAELASAMNDMCTQLEAARLAVRKETEMRLEAMDQLRHSERLAMLGRLASGIAHELGTPLNVVAGRANLIATEDLSREDVVAFSNTIAEQARRMTEIIRQLLGFAHRRPGTREMSDLTQLATQIIDLLTPTAYKSNVTLELEKTEGVPDVSVSRSHIQQVLMNLVMNGIHAMPRGGRLKISVGVARSRHLRVDAGPERDYVTINVEDEGVGISEDEIKQVFDPFFTTKESGKGTGLGLSIAQGIAEEHDGWIDVVSVPGEGSQFIVYLPIEVQR